MKLLGRAVLAGVACWLAGGLALAQFSSTIQGVVTDSSGAVVPQVHVRVTNVATGVARDSSTNGEGLYRVLNLGPGEYRVTAENPGFRPVTQEGVQLASNEAVRGSRAAGRRGDRKCVGHGPGGAPGNRTRARLRHD